MFSDSWNVQRIPPLVEPKLRVETLPDVLSFVGRQSLPTPIIPSLLFFAPFLGLPRRLRKDQGWVSAQRSEELASEDADGHINTISNDAESEILCHEDVVVAIWQYWYRPGVWIGVANSSVCVEKIAGMV